MLDLRIIKPARFSIQGKQKKGNIMRKIYKVEKNYVENLNINGKVVALGRKERRGAHALLQHLADVMPGCFPLEEKISWDAESQELIVPMGFTVYWLNEDVHSIESGNVYITFSGTGRNPLSIFKNYKEEGNGTHSYLFDFSGLSEEIDHFAEVALILW